MSSLAGARCLYVSYNGLTTPLVQSQVLPYLRGLAQLGARFVLLTYEPANARAPDASLIADLAANGIVWKHLRYHQTPTLPATAYDIGAGIAYATLLSRKYAFNMVHARGYPPAMIARGLQLSRRLPFIFDMRGLMADEYVDAGRWSRASLAYGVTKRAEGHLLAHADCMVVLTDRIRRVLWPARERENVTTIPCCVDARAFAWPPRSWDTLAQQLGLHGKRVVVYAGSVGTWYLLDAMLRFGAFLHGRDARQHLLILNVGEHALIRARMTALGIDPGCVTVTAVPPSQVPSYLGFAEAALCFVRPSYSKQASSPTKVAEYLAAGLPVVSTAGVGDLDDLLAGNRVGVLLRGTDEADFATAAAELATLVADHDTPSRCRAIAEGELSLARGVAAYAELYAHLLGIA